LLHPEKEEARQDNDTDFEIEGSETENVPPRVEMKILTPVIKNHDEEPDFVIEENLQPEESDEDNRGSLDSIYDPKLDLPTYQLPPLSLLEDYKDKIFEVSREELEKNNRRIVQTLNNYKISIEKIYARPGPTVTLYEIYPAPGVRVSQIKRLGDDIALSLAARGVRIIAPIPGTSAVGIEVANDRPSVVPMASILDTPKLKEAKFDLPIVIGKGIPNEIVMFDLASMPHLLVAGTTGTGKSVGLNVIITSLLYRMHPSILKLVLVDPKKVELSLYNKLEKHFLAKLPDSDEPIITDPQKVVYTLRSLCKEMYSRYDLLKMAHVRNIKEYNEKYLSRRLNPNKGHRFMPFVVVIIDEFCDMIMTAGREVEEPISRLAQLARAIGIHLVFATQRPVATVITGLIKANFTARIAFKVVQKIDSNIILDTTGADQLIGKGDMLLLIGSELTRVQCAFIDTKEVEKITEFIGNQKGYSTAHFLPEYSGEEEGGAIEVDMKKRDSLFDEAAKLVVQYQQGSTSLIQRRMNLGYNRAGRIMDQLEAAGIVGPAEGSKARQVLVSDFASLDRILAAFGV
jgi:S-DNA-T family DNA segregation ATPase FtsK/SpoIIIE